MSLRFILVLTMLVSDAISHLSALQNVNHLLPAKSISNYYRYGYEVSDAEENSEFSHSQTSQAGETKGEYRTFLPDGRWQTVSYIADDKGYRAFIRYDDPIQPISNEPVVITRGKSRQWKTRNRAEKESSSQPIQLSGAGKKIGLYMETDRWRPHHNQENKEESLDEESLFETPRRNSIDPVGYVGTNGWKTRHLGDKEIRVVVGKTKAPSRSRYIDTDEWKTRNRGEKEASSEESLQSEPIELTSTEKKRGRNSAVYMETNKLRLRNPFEEEESSSEESFWKATQQEPVDSVSVDEQRGGYSAGDIDLDEWHIRSSVEEEPSDEEYFWSSEQQEPIESSSEEAFNEAPQRKPIVSGKKRGTTTKSKTRNSSEKKLSFFNVRNGAGSDQGDSLIIHPPPTVGRRSPVPTLEDDYRKFKGNQQPHSSDQHQYAESQETGSEDQSLVSLVRQHSLRLRQQHSPQQVKEHRSSKQSLPSTGSFYGKRIEPLKRIVSNPQSLQLDEDEIVAGKGDILDRDAAVLEVVVGDRPTKSPTGNRTTKKKGDSSAIKIRKIKLSRFQVEDPPAKVYRRLRFPPNVRTLENSERIARQISPSLSVS